MAGKNKPINYVNNKTLYNELVKWYDTRRNDDHIPDVIVIAIMQICERLGTKSNFRGYTYIDEMVASAIMNCTIALKDKKFNPTKSENPFAYFTQIAYNEFIRIINEEKKHSYIKLKSFEHHTTASMLNGEPAETTIEKDGRGDDLINKFEKRKQPVEVSDHN